MKKKYFLIFILLVIQLIILTNITLESNSSNKKNLNFPINKDSIEVYIDINYPPYIFVDEDGNLTGFLYDLWKLWESQTGIRVILKAFNWDETLRRFKEGEGDIIDTIFFNEERAKWLSYGKPYEKIDVPIFYHKSISGIDSIKSLRGFSVAVKAEDNCINILKNNGIKDLILYESYEDIIKEAKYGNIKIFSIDGPPANYYLVKYRIYHEFKIGPVLYSGQFHRAVRKGNEDLLKFVEDNFNEIREIDIKKLRNRWFGVSLFNVFYFRIIVMIIIAIIIVFIILIIINIILRKEVETKTLGIKKVLEELSIEKEKLKTLINSIPESFAIIDKNLVIENFHIPEKFENQKNIDYKNILNILLKDKEITDSILLIFDAEYDYIEKIKKIEIDNKEYYLSIKIFPFQYNINNIKIVDSDYNNISKNNDFVIKRINGLQLIKENDTFQKKNINIKNILSSIILYIQDISDIKAMEENLLKTQKFQMIGILAGGIAHDFNNILHGISGIASLMKINIEEGNIDKNELLENIEVIEKAISKGAGIVNQVLELARESKSKEDLCDLNLIIKNSILIVSSSIDKSVKINFEPYHEKAIIKGDKIKLEQAFINLILNANDSMTIMRKDDKIGGNISIKVEKMKQFNKENFVVTIKDEGIGIPEEFKDKIFDPFFTTKTDGKGTGLGLSIVYKIISSHGGNINFISKVGAGTIFYVYLPVYRESIDYNEIVLEEGKLIKGEGKVLIVDDDETVLNATKKILTKCGYEVYLAKNGDDGLKLFIQNKDFLSLAIIDFIMPGLSGIELLKKIKEISPDFKIIFATGYLEDFKLKEINDIKLNYKDVIFINKPFNFIELSLIINDLLQK